MKILNIIDEFTWKCLAILVARKIETRDVVNLLFRPFIFRGIPEHIRSDEGPDPMAKAIGSGLNRLRMKTRYVGPASPWDNGYIKSFNGNLRDELLDREIFTTLKASILIEQSRKEYNQASPQCREPSSSST